MPHAPETFRVRILHALLLGMGLAELALVGWAVFWSVDPNGMNLGVGTLMALLSLGAGLLGDRVPYRVGAWLVVLNCVIMSGLAMSVLAFLPAPALLAFGALIWSGLFLRPREVVWVMGVLVVMITTIGWAMTTGRLTPPPLSALDPAVPVNWIRVGGTLLAIGALFAYTAGQVLLRLDQALADAAVAQQQALEAQRRQLESEHALAQAQRVELMGRVTGGLAHDINNDLMVLAGWAELLPGLARDDELREAAEAMSTSAAHATAMMRQILAFGRPEELGVSVTPVDLAEACRASLPVLGRVLPATITLRTELDPGSWVRLASRNLHQVLLNLLLNARDALNGRGTVWLRVRKHGDQVLLQVEDDGPGLDPQVAARIFEPFFTTKGDEGSGLGLASVRQVVESAGGTVSVERVEPAGTRFTVRLPQA